MAEVFDQARTQRNQFLAPTSRTARLVDEARKYIPGGTSRIHYYFAPYPIYAHSGSGCRLTDVDGVERLDFLNNMTSLVHGHANPRINEAVIAQLGLGTAFSEPSEPEVRLARLIVERVPSVQQIRFANSGTEAVMMAIKLARAFTGRQRIAKFEGFYHGYYDYVQVSFNTAPENWGALDQPAAVASSGGLADSVVNEDVVVLPFNDRPAVERLLAQHGPSLAAVIVDPLANRAGFPRPAEGFYAFLREITRSHGIALIYDEVISFRIGYHGAQGKYGGDPDLTTFGKIIGGGLPIGAVGGAAEIMALLDPTHRAPVVLSGGTFSGNPLSMVAGLAAMEQLNPDEYERLNRLGEQLRSRATAAFQTAGEPGQ
ncbi:MAG TPA: aspartate aminotransferase family protein, partial [Chloroflexota bacterium]|nr:aspartate aminotransferase family protein [Chloroflexota bacterium]